MPSRGRVAVYAPATDTDSADLAAAAARWGLVDGVSAYADLVVPVDGRAQRATVPVYAVDLDAALPALLRVEITAAPAWRAQPDSVRVWALAARLALRLVAGEQLVPRLVAGPDAGTPLESGVHGVWQAWLAHDQEAGAAAARLAAAMPPAAHAVAGESPDAVWSPDALLTAFLSAVGDLAVRRAAPPPRAGRPRARLLPWTARWAEALTDPDDTLVPLRSGTADMIAAVDNWLATAGADATLGLVELTLEAPGTQDGAWWLRFALRLEPRVLLPAGDVWQGTDAAAQEALLAGLGRCARVFPPVEAALADVVPEALALSLDDAWTFISEAAPLLEAGGMAVHLPAGVHEHELHARLRVGDDEPEQKPEETYVEARWEIALGDDTLTDEELEALLAAGRPLVRWRDRWVRIEPEVAGRLRGLRPKGAGAPLRPPGGRLPLAEALALALVGSTVDDALGEGAGEVEVVASGRVAGLLDRLRAAAEQPPAPVTPPGFSGELRPYQQRGVAWLEGMGRLGLGAVLADEMGLGKTIELIAYLLARGGTGAERGTRAPLRPPGPHLVVCPTSVVGNWEREVRRFAPGLDVLRHHGTQRSDDLADAKGLVLTTYGTLRRDVELLATIDWDVVAFDEAQHVKNPETAGARAARRLSRRHAVALTGTPLENRLAELWALLDLVAPGLLGTRARFTRRFALPIERRGDRGAVARLRRLVAPFVLRREKRDPEVSSDLPDKIERSVPCPLTAEQAALYRATVEQGWQRLRDASAMARRGRILALLTRLKQICNHPAQFRGDDPATAVLAGRSGKLAVARELIADVADGGDQALVFTQYVAMGRLLARQLSEDLDADIPLLHGGLPVGTRDRMVAAFQRETDDPPPPALVVSLRAGGTGLNLTAATHVLHYDRWWNPAVEDQATDRAHRIGQQRTVEVHKLVTAGTLEERIDELLTSKRALAGAIVGAGEAWITELGDAELAELLALGEDAEIADLDEDEDLRVEEAS